MGWQVIKIFHRLSNSLHDQLCISNQQTLPEFYLYLHEHYIYIYCITQLQKLKVSFHCLFSFN